MLTKPLTIAQQAVLDELKKPGVSAFYMRYMGRFNPDPYWFLSSTRKHCTKQIEALNKRGLLKIERDKSGSDQAWWNGQ